MVKDPHIVNLTLEVSPRPRAVTADDKALDRLEGVGVLERCDDPPDRPDKRS